MDKPNYYFRFNDRDYEAKSFEDCHTGGFKTKRGPGRYPDECEGCDFESSLEGCYLRTGHPEDI